MATEFTQIHLADMEKGLAKLLAVIALPPTEITRLTGIVFETAYEESFDYVFAALMLTNQGKQFSLRQYYRIRKRYPDRTELIGSERSRDPISDTTEFLTLMQIPEASVLWRCSDTDEVG